MQMVSVIGGNHIAISLVNTDQKSILIMVQIANNWRSSIPALMGISLICEPYLLLRR